MTKQGDHFWFMSFVANGPRGTYATHRTGCFDIAQGATRQAAFVEILTSLRQQNPDLADATVTAFDIQPNKL
ncbi:hypothetical protein [Streptomyces zaomyceticus]|uniref:hypothetical protein n=1 Tax=Streptomyces zaomyceticus TaxID=68286 RepID=UPI002E130589|nr:hypothetical protein OG237_15830 [Streptomyces zaomyceticus]